MANAVYVISRPAVHVALQTRHRTPLGHVAAWFYRRFVGTFLESTISFVFFDSSLARMMSVVAASVAVDAIADFTINVAIGGPWMAASTAVTALIVGFGAGGPPGAVVACFWGWIIGSAVESFSQELIGDSLSDLQCRILAWLVTWTSAWCIGLFTASCYEKLIARRPAIFVPMAQVIVVAGLLLLSVSLVTLFRSRTASVDWSHLALAYWNAMAMRLRSADGRALCVMMAIATIGLPVLASIAWAFERIDRGWQNPLRALFFKYHGLVACWLLVLAVTLWAYQFAGLEPVPRLSDSLLRAWIALRESSFMFVVDAVIAWSLCSGIVAVTIWYARDRRLSADTKTEKRGSRPPTVRQGPSISPVTAAQLQAILNCARHVAGHQERAKVTMLCDVSKTVLSAHSLSSPQRFTVARSRCLDLARSFNESGWHAEAMQLVDLGLSMDPTDRERAIGLAVKGEALCCIRDRGRLQNGVATSPIQNATHCDEKALRMFEASVAAEPIVGRLLSADSMTRCRSLGLLEVAEQWVDALIVSHGGELDGRMRTEVDDLKRRIRARHRLLFRRVLEQSLRRSRHRRRTVSM